MRNEPYEKPKLVKEMAHAFTEYMCKTKKVPGFRMSARDYSKMVEHPEIAPNIVADSDQDGVYGTVYGVRFYVDGNYNGQVEAVEGW